ncbi:hypothetical protein AB0I77_19655 [Streptomyces sp. NPDC050619]|uniref:hypothetical protein n=1 Tax=Streptomyces sp. NPDC050619 TaxID=3157214 RepID=UPI00343D5917
MPIRHALATVVLGTALAVGTMAAPAQATSQSAAPRTATVSSGTPTSSGDVSVQAYTTSKGGYIREDYYGSAAAVSWTYNGESLYVYGYGYNSYGNKWYYVEDSLGSEGWIYCGNVTAGC